jgi:hypothetical protein
MRNEVRTGKPAGRDIAVKRIKFVQALLCLLSDGGLISVMPANTFFSKFGMF